MAPSCQPQQSRSVPYRKTLLATLISASLIGGVVPMTAHAAAPAAVLQQNYMWDLPAQPLSVSLTDLAERAGLALLLPPGQLQGISGQPLRGQLSVEQALNNLLRNSGYRFDVEDGTRLVLVPASVSQANTPSSAQTESMVIVGDWLDNANGETQFSFPGARHVLNKETIQERGVASLTEAFRQIPGMQVRVPTESYGANHSLSVGARGLKSRFSEKSTILLDGMPLSFAPYGQPQLSIAPISLGNLSAIDVVKGGSSVRYGPQNVGGIINFVTPDIPKDTVTRLNLRAETPTDGKSGVLGQANAFIGGAVSDSTRMALIYSGSHGSGYRDNSDEDIDDIMLKVKTELNERESLEGHLRYFNAETEIPGGLNPEQFAEDRYQSRFNYNHFDGDRTEGRIKYSNFLSDTQEFEIQAFAANTYRLYGLQFNPDSRQRYDEWAREYDVYGIEPRFSQLLEFGDTEHEVSVGYRYIKESADLTRHRWNGFAIGSAPRSVEGVLRTQDKTGTTAHAAYIDDRIMLGDWTLTPGVRVENVEVFRDSIIRKNNPNDFRNEQDYTKVLPSMSIGYQLSSDVTLFANYNTSFGTLQHLQLADRTTNNLEPEIARTVELGARYRDAGLTAELTLFNINFDNKLQWDDNLGYHANRGSTHHYGFESGISYAFSDSGLSTYANLAYTQAEFEEGDLQGKELPYYSNWVGNLGLRYDHQDWTYNLDGYAQSAQFSDNENTRDLTVVNNTYYRGELPGFMIWNARASYRFDEHRVSFGVKNLFGQDYYTLSGPDQPYGSGISAGAPTTLYVELDMAF